jgi:hypothetical protein
VAGFPNHPPNGAACSPHSLVSVPKCKRKIRARSDSPVDYRTRLQHDALASYAAATCARISGSCLRSLI